MYLVYKRRFLRFVLGGVSLHGMAATKRHGELEDMHPQNKQNFRNIGPVPNKSREEEAQWIKEYLQCPQQYLRVQLTMAPPQHAHSISVVIGHWSSNPAMPSSLQHLNSQVDYRLYSTRPRKRHLSKHDTSRGFLHCFPVHQPRRSQNQQPPLQLLQAWNN